MKIYACVKLVEWRTIGVRQELLDAVKRTLERHSYRSLTEFVSEAIQLYLGELTRSHEKTEEREYPVIHERARYTLNHMWATVTPRGNIRVGLSDYAARALRGISHIQTEKVGCEVKRGEPFGVVQTSRFMVDLCSPVNGKIIKVNEALRDDPSIINKDPYGAGWIAEIEPNDLTSSEELRNLMTRHQYETWLIRHHARRRA